MITWPAKDPADVADYTWTPDLDSGDHISTFVATATSGTVAQHSGATHTNFAGTVWLEGGVDGEVATFSLIVTTTGGRTFREAATIPVVDHAGALLVQFRLRFPAFATVDDGTVGYWLADAANTAGTSWGDDRDVARLLLAAHNVAQANASIPGGVTSFKSGTFSATVSDMAANRTGFSATPYGREYLDLMRRNFAGPISAWVPPAYV
jgi:hypothetical protein